jgi:rRNA maturation RNase YbeY
MSKIAFYTENIKMPAINKSRVKEWLKEVAAFYNKEIGALNYIFCGDDRIIEVNNQFLCHNYYTDIITFDYSDNKVVSGDMYISVDTICSNSLKYKTSFDTELHRVIVHGLLHLCGINDKGPGERKIMEAAEDRALSLLNR